MAQTYSVVDYRNDTVVDDNMTADDFMNWYIDSFDWYDWLDEHKYTESYGVKVLRHLMVRHNDRAEATGEGFSFETFEFFPSENVDF